MRLLSLGALFFSGLSFIGCSSDSAATHAPDGGSGGEHAEAAPPGAGGRAGVSDGGGGSGTSGGSGARDAGRPDAEGDAGPVEGGRVDAGDSGTSDAGLPSKSGYVVLASRATDVATVFANSVNAGFNDGPGGSSGKGCQRNVVGTCAVVLCDFTNGGDQTPPPGAPVSAGTVTIGGTTPAFSLDYDAGAMQYAVSVPVDHAFFTGGDTIMFAASGRDVPAFSANVVAPTPVTVTSPTLPGGAFSLDTSKDLVFDWTGSSAGMLAFNIRTTTSIGATAVSSSFVSCQFRASARTGTIPVALLANLDKTGASTTALLGTDLSSTKEVVAGDFSLHLAVGSVATKADGKTPYAASQVTVL